MSAVYNIRSTEQAGVFTITKFDDDMNVESSYTFKNTTDGYICECPAGQRQTCRHRQMFPMLQLRVDSPWFLDFDTRQWVDPTGEAASAASSAGQELDRLYEEQMIEDAKCPQGSLGQSSLTADIPLREVQEESHTYEQVTKLPDSHPFRRRM